MVIGDIARDIEETDIVTEHGVFCKSIIVALNMRLQTLYSDDSTYISKYGSVWSKFPLTSRTKRKIYNMPNVLTGLTSYNSQFWQIKGAFQLYFS